MALPGSDEAEAGAEVTQLRHSATRHSAAPRRATSAPETQRGTHYSRSGLPGMAYNLNISRIMHCHSLAVPFILPRPLIPLSRHSLSFTQLHSVSATSGHPTVSQLLSLISAALLMHVVHSPAH